jgi:hypothetical protein
VDKYNLVQNVINSLTHRSLVQSIDLTDQETPDSTSFNKKLTVLKMNSQLNQSLTTETVPKMNMKLLKVPQDKSIRMKNKDKDALRIKM